MNSELVSIGTQLTRAEADSIKSGLQSINVHFVENGHDAANRYSSLYFEIRVERKNFERAIEVVKARQKQTKVESKKCPKCEGDNYKELKKDTLWKKIYYYGTTLVQCRDCRTKYPI